MLEILWLGVAATLPAKDLVLRPFVSEISSRQVSPWPGNVSKPFNLSGSSDRVNNRKRGLLIWPVKRDWL